MKKTGFIICLIGFIVLGSLQTYQYVSSSKAERRLAGIVEKVNAAETVTASPTAAPKKTDAAKAAAPTETPTPTPTTDPLAERGITIPEKNLNWEELKANENQDIYSWIYIPGTNVDYPVLQHPTEPSYYLDHNIDGSEGYPGCIYTKNVNKKDWTDPNTVIYGHNMKDGTMFRDLHKFEDKAFFDEHQYMFIYTPEGTKVYEIFAAYTFSNLDLMMCFNYTTPDMVQIYFDGIWTNRDMNSHFRDDVVLQGDSSKIITMSTCIGGQPDKRYLVQAVLLNP